MRCSGAIVGLVGESLEFGDGRALRTQIAGLGKDLGDPGGMLDLGLGEETYH